MGAPCWSRYRADCVPYRTGCRQCGKEIPNRRAYCSTECQTTFEVQHFWNTARWEALKRAGQKGWGARQPATCVRCTRPCAGYGREPEVNHVRPLNRLPGVSYNFGCHNHQDNLEVVCHECHVRITVEQRRAGLIGPAARPQALHGATQPPLLD